MSVRQGVCNAMIERMIAQNCKHNTATKITKTKTQQKHERCNHNTETKTQKNMKNANARKLRRLADVFPGLHSSSRAEPEDVPQLKKQKQNTIQFEPAFEVQKGPTDFYKQCRLIFATTFNDTKQLEALCLS